MSGNVKNSVFINNQVKDTTTDGSGNDIQGGAIYLSRKCKLSFSDSTFTNNMSAGEGGAIYATSNCNITIKTCDFGGNLALNGYMAVQFQFTVDYLNFKFVDWTSYGNYPATDMMHTKVCAASNYVDMEGEDHSYGIWMSCQNLDGINEDGTNGHTYAQTAVIITNHEMIYKVTFNYLNLLSQYAGQEAVYEFRELVNFRTKEQIDLILAGKADEINSNEQIVYLGTEFDDVFELYFAPFGGSSNVWDETYNPYCKYIREFSQSDDYVTFVWVNPKFYNDSALMCSIEDMIVQAYHENTNKENKIFLLLPDFNTNKFDDLAEGIDIGYKSFGNYV